MVSGSRDRKSDSLYAEARKRKTAVQWRIRSDAYLFARRYAARPTIRKRSGDAVQHDAYLLRTCAQRAMLCLSGKTAAANALFRGAARTREMRAPMLYQTPLPMPLFMPAQRPPLLFFRRLRPGDICPLLTRRSYYQMKISTVVHHARFSMPPYYWLIFHAHRLTEEE